MVLGLDLGPRVVVALAGGIIGGQDHRATTSQGHSSSQKGCGITVFCFDFGQPCLFAPTPPKRKQGDWEFVVHSECYLFFFHFIFISHGWEGKACWGSIPLACCVVGSPSVIPRWGRFATKTPPFPSGRVMGQVGTVESVFPCTANNQVQLRSPINCRQAATCTATARGTSIFANHLEERLLDQARARAPYTPLFWGCSRSIPQGMVSNV